jgi:tetratricopeptide (TPR) repeat protein
VGNFLLIFCFVFNFHSLICQSIVAEKKNSKTVFTNAELLYQQNKLDESLELFKTIENIDTLSPAVNYRLACIFLDKKEIDEAKFYIGKALHSNPNKNEFLTKQADILVQNFEFKETVKIRKKLVELNPQYPSRYEDLIKNLIQVSEFNDVIIYCQQFENQFGLSPNLMRFYEYAFSVNKQFDSVIDLKRRYYLKHPEDFQNFQDYYTSFYRYHPENAKLELKQKIKNDSLNFELVEFYIQMVEKEYFIANSIEKLNIYNDNKELIFKSIQHPSKQNKIEKFAGLEIILDNEPSIEKIKLIYFQLKRDNDHLYNQGHMSKIFWRKFYDLNEYLIASEILEVIRIQNIDDLENYYYLVRCYYELNQAIKIDNLILDLRETFPFLENQIQTLSAIVLQMKGKNEEASLIFNEQLSLIKPWNKIMGDAYNRLGRAQIALKYYKQALNDSDLNESSYINLIKKLKTTK